MTVCAPTDIKPESCELVDVRTPAEFRALHARGARNVPLDRLNPAEVWASKAEGRKLVLLCKGGTRAKQAAEKLVKAGYTEVCVVEGGTDAWTAAGMPVERSTGGTISLERQVRIVAGFLVLTGVVLGLTVHVGFLVLSGFVGAGLIFAGITDWCGMAMLLGRCPWNR